MSPRFAFPLLLLLLGLFARPVAAGGEQVIVAVFDMEDKGSGLDAEVLVNLTDYLAVLLTESGYQVIPRDQIRARLKEQKAESHKECHDQSCQVEMGRELAAQKSLATQIFRAGSQCRVTALFYDLRRAATDKAVRVKSSCTEEGLLVSLEELAAMLTGKKVDADKAKKEKERQAKEEADRKIKEEAERRAKIEAERQAKEEADRQARLEAERKANEKLSAALEAEKERLAAEKAEAERKMKEKAEAEEGGAADFKSWVFRFRFGALFPSFSDDTGIYVDEAYSRETSPGSIAGIELAWRPLRYLALGLMLDFEHQEIWGAYQMEPGDSFYNRLDAGLRLWGILPVGDSLDLRLGIGLGAGIVLEGDIADNVGLAGDPGASADVCVGAAYAFADWFALSADLGMKILIEGWTDDDHSYGMGPNMFLMIGTEFMF